MSLVRGTVATQGQAWSTSLLRYVDLTVDASGNLNVSSTGGAGGTVDQGTGGVSPWLVSATNLDVALSTRLKPADTLAGVTTLGTITNVVHVDDNTGSLTVDTPNLDVALSTRLKPADTLTGLTTLGTITNVVHIDDNNGSLTVDGPLTDTQLRASVVPISGTVTTSAAVSNSSPTYTEGATSALAQTLSGQLRVTERLAPDTLDMLGQILVEVRLNNFLIHTTLNSRDDLDRLRLDLTY